MADPELLRKLTEQNKIADYAMQVLKMDERRADAFVKVAGSFLHWDGTLQFKNSRGQYVAADVPQAKGFFEREFDYLIPAQTVEEQQADIPAELVEKARDGSITAKGQLFRLLHGDKPKAAEGETHAALAKLLKGEAPKDGDGERKRDASGKFVPEVREADASNPWSKEGWNLTSQGRVLRNDPARAERLAKSARSFIGATRPAA
ncbi:MAG TPA: hypothetical protein VN742_09665 [Candidatus Binataceae bacterium]|nr:hypothetical protein [Candidatus Binataceae bacterium]